MMDLAMVAVLLLACFGFMVAVYGAAGRWIQAATKIRSKGKVQNDDRREQHDIIGNCNSADSGLFALCPGLSRKIIETKCYCLQAWLLGSSADIKTGQKQE